MSVILDSTKYSCVSCVRCVSCCRLFGAQDKNTNTLTNTTLYSLGNAGTRLSLGAPIGC